MNDNSDMESGMEWMKDKLSYAVKMQLRQIWAKICIQVYFGEQITNLQKWARFSYP